MSKHVASNPRSSAGEMFTFCRSVLLDCAAAANDVSVLYVFSDDPLCREQARDSLLCAHACTRALRILTSGDYQSEVGLWSELQLVSRLCETCAAECHGDVLKQPAIALWKSTCQRVSLGCQSALTELMQGASQLH